MRERIRLNDAETGQIKMERPQGIISIALYLAIVGGFGYFLLFLLRDLHLLSDIFSENELKAIVNYVPLIPITIIFIIRYMQTLKDDIKRLTKKIIIFTLVVTIMELIFNRGSSMVLINIFNGTSANQEINDRMLNDNFVFALANQIIYAPIVEELLFRKALSQIITNDKIFFILSAISFGLFHGFDITTLKMIITGAIYAFIYLKTDKNIVAPIIAHFINNLTFSIV